MDTYAEVKWNVARKNDLFYALGSIEHAAIELLSLTPGHGINMSVKGIQGAFVHSDLRAVDSLARLRSLAMLLALSKQMSLLLPCPSTCLSFLLGWNTKSRDSLQTWLHCYRHDTHLMAYKHKQQE